jgi:antitoxin component YwqK of YwqJK toxin-antitoxin module
VFIEYFDQFFGHGDLKFVSPKHQNIHRELIGEKDFYGGVHAEISRIKGLMADFYNVYTFNIKFWISEWAYTGFQEQNSASQVFSYIGFRVKGKKQGYGKLYMRDLSFLDFFEFLRYSGTFVDDKMEGPSAKYYNEFGGLEYIGSFYQDKRSGHGAWYRDNKLVYRGLFREDLPDSKQIATTYHQNGAVNYRGSIKDGKRNCTKGKSYWTNGMIMYDGGFLGNKFSGDCNKLYYDCGTILYVGPMEQHCKQGQGVEYYSNGKVCFVGNFQGNSPNTKKFSQVYNEDGTIDYRSSSLEDLDEYLLY